MKNTKKFVIQKHAKVGEIHWDLMLEADNTLRTYRLPLPPEKLSQQPTTAVKIFDHTLKFLTYQGSVNKGQGTVQIADTGTYQLLNKDKKHQQLRLNGRILKGKFALTYIEGDNWTFERLPKE